MPRTYKSKNVQTRKELAGPQNIPKEFIAKKSEKDEDKRATLYSLNDLFQTGMQRYTNRRPRGNNWSEEDMAKSLMEYFTFMSEKSLKPSYVSLALFLGTTKDQITIWKNHAEKYGEVSRLINSAAMVIEQQYIERSEQYPTSNLFLLKSKYGYNDVQKIEITAKQNVQEDEIKEVIDQLGLNAQNPTVVSE